MTNLISEVCTITPEMAGVYLQNCSRDNRAINRNRVLFYAKQMKDGQWQLNGETIIFSDKNILLNGYHRMNAVVEAGIPVQFLVVRNVNEESFKTIDTGKPRSVGDVYKMANILNATCVAAVVRRYMLLNKGSKVITSASHSSCDSLKISNTDMLATYYTAPETFQEFNNYACCLKKKYNLFPQSDLGGVMSYLHLSHGYDKSLIYDFFNVLYQYNVEDENPRKDFFPCKNLRERIVQAALKNQKLSQRYRQMLLAKAWSCWVANKDLKILKINDGEDVSFA